MAQDAEQAANVLAYSPGEGSAVRMRSLLFLSCLLMILYMLLAGVCEYECQRFGRHTSLSLARFQPLYMARESIASGSVGLMMFVLSVLNLGLVCGRLIAAKESGFARSQVVLALALAMAPFFFAAVLVIFYQGPVLE